MAESKQPMRAEQRQQIIQQVIEVAKKTIEDELDKVEIDEEAADVLIKFGDFGPLFLNAIFDAEPWDLSEFLESELPTLRRVVSKLEKEKETDSP